MIRLGLCCQFKNIPIKFRKTTVKYVKRLSEGKNHLEYISELIAHNSLSLLSAIQYCFENGIGAFRINSQLFPLFTHPIFAYELDHLPQRESIYQNLEKAKKLAIKFNVRLTFHPDQFVVLNSLNDAVVERSIKELEYHGLMSHLVGADVINLHAGGSYGDKIKALERFEKNYQKLSKRVKKRLTIENDDKIYSPFDLIPLCKRAKIPLVYDVHHHRCHSDHLTIEEATKLAIETWNREPLFHISSPKEGWKSKKPQLHHNFIDPEDVPDVWQSISPLTIDVEAKFKEIAVLRLREELIQKGWNMKGERL